MNLKLTWKSTVAFPELESTSGSFAAGEKLEVVLAEMFVAIRDSIMRTCDEQDEYPRWVGVKIDVGVFDGEGKQVLHYTPRKLFELMPQADRVDLKSTKRKKEVNHGR